MRNLKHQGLYPHRLSENAGNPLEVAYAEAWEAENKIVSGRPTPLLAHLLNGDFNQRDATVAATIIQWLGSHVGSSFVNEVLRKAKSTKA